MQKSDVFQLLENQTLKYEKRAIAERKIWLQRTSAKSIVLSVCLFGNKF